MKGLTHGSLKPQEGQLGKEGEKKHRVGGGEGRCGLKGKLTNGVGPSEAESEGMIE